MTMRSGKRMQTWILVFPNGQWQAAPAAPAALSSESSMMAACGMCHSRMAQVGWDAAKGAGTWGAAARMGWYKGAKLDGVYKGAPGDGVWAWAEVPSAGGLG